MDSQRYAGNAPGESGSGIGREPPVGAASGAALQASAEPLALEGIVDPSTDRPVDGGTKSAPPYFPSLDGLRALSVFMVIMAHTRGYPGVFALFPGWLGVDVFFALSGFLIMVLLLREARLKGKVDLEGFYTRRFFRIIPVYTVILAIYVFLNWHRGGQVWSHFKTGLPYYLGFMNEYSPVDSFGFTWTLGIEEKFYLIWPALCFVLFPKIRRSLTLGVYVLLLALMPWSYQNSRSYSGLILGCGLALLVSGSNAGRVKGAMERLPAAIPVVLVFGAAYLCSRNVNFVVLFSLAMILLIAHLVLRASWLTTILASPLLVWVGKRSYSMYLIHGLILGSIEARFPPVTVAQRVGVALTVTGLATLVAHILYLTIEDPARRLGKRLIKDRRSRAASARELPVS